MAVLARGAAKPAPETLTMSLKYQAMERQPEDLRRLRADGWRQARQAADLLDGAERLIVTGVGASFHAAMVAGWMFRSIGFDARAINAADIWCYPEQFPFRCTDAVIVVSHAGTHPATIETLRLARAASATLLSVGSLTTEHAGSRLILRTVERETPAGFTASHLAAMYVLAQVAALLGERMRPLAVDGWRGELDRLPETIEAILRRQAEITPIAEAALDRRIFAAAAGPNEATVRELMLRTTESDRVWVEAIGLEQFLHGPIVTAGPGDVSVLVRTPGANAKRMAASAVLLERVGSRLWVVGEPVEGIAQASQFALPPVSELLSPLLNLVPMQMLAHEVAVRGGTTPKTICTREALRFCSNRP